MGLLRVSPGFIEKLWNVLKFTLVVIRKGLISKRKLIMGMNLIVKRRNLIPRTLRNLLVRRYPARDVLAYGPRDYEFSCSNTPSPVFSRVRPRRRMASSIIPCMNLPHVTEADEDFEGSGADDRAYDSRATVLLPRTPDHFEEKVSPLLTYSSSSPYSVVICEYSSSEEEEDGNDGKVDDEAEEFIRRFREQLWMQNRVQLLQC
ncbi:hypothetical protein MLD38_026833 [Melastoma candidum]|uniref:Uncharacterized protein n=1 Tax=Melastoma candidum TaxID=119954 RepID=A0ACB9P2R3_9MYRT|nr:hypothetical protein MLD38_026833 [Melastoma candidum]